MKLVLFLFLLSVLHESLQEHFNAFLCDFCNCTNKEDLTVVCKDGDVSIQHIFDDNSWFDVERKPYPYRHLTIHRIEMMTLDSPFPQSNLVSLEISEGAISSIANGVFINLQSMRELSLSRNRLIAISPEVFRGNTSEGEYLPLKSLRVLKLDHNQIFEIEPHLFKHITNLEVLDLSVNPLTTITLEAQQAFAELSNLRELYLSTTRIKTLPDHFLHTHANLEVLDLSGNPISAIPQDLKYAENLHTLYLNDTQLITLDNKTGFPKVPNLKVLYMCHITPLVNISAGAFSGLESLEELYLNDNVNLRQIDDYAFAEKQEEGGAIYPPIKKFYIQNNKLESVARELIASWDRLVGLDLGGNKWSCDCTNQWIIDNLLPTYATIEGIEKSKELKCGSPIEMDGMYMHALREKHYQLRCLDVYGARPENDGTILIGLLAGILITIPLVLFLMYAYQRNWFGLFSSSPAAYSRQFYNRTTDDNMF